MADQQGITVRFNYSEGVDKGVIAKCDTPLGDELSKWTFDLPDEITLDHPNSIKNRKP